MCVTHQPDYTADSATKHPGHTDLPEPFFRDLKCFSKKESFVTFPPLAVPWTRRGNEEFTEWRAKTIMKSSKLFCSCVLARKEITNTRELVSFSPKPVYLVNQNQKCLSVTIPVEYFEYYTSNYLIPKQYICSLIDDLPLQTKKSVERLLIID